MILPKEASSAWGRQVARQQRQRNLLRRRRPSPFTFTLRSINYNVFIHVFFVFPDICARVVFRADFTPHIVVSELPLIYPKIYILLHRCFRVSRFPDIG